MSILSWLRRDRRSGAAPDPPAPQSVALGDLAGAVLAQLTLAQAQADAKSVELGELYRQHPVLARFGIPGLALESAEIDVRCALLPAASPAASAAAQDADDAAHDAGDAAGLIAAGVHVLFSPSHLASLPPEHISTIRMKVRSNPKRLVEVEGHPLLLP